MTKPTIGFIGLGVMGKPMARNLLKTLEQANRYYGLDKHSTSGYGGTP